VLGTFPAIIDVWDLFSGIEIRPHMLNAAFHPAAYPALRK
jgi:hypothetical protein